MAERAKRAKRAECECRSPSLERKEYYTEKPVYPKKKTSKVSNRPPVSDLSDADSDNAFLEDIESRKKLRKRFSMTESLKSLVGRKRGNALDPDAPEETDPQKMKEWRGSFENLWNTGMELVEMYLKNRKKFIMEFYHACEDYKNYPKDQLCNEAKRLYKTYLNPWSAKFVMLGRAHHEIARDVIRKPNHKSFNEVQCRLRKRMEEVYYENFLKSDEYKTFLEAKGIHR